MVFAIYKGVSGQDRSLGPALDCADNGKRIVTMGFDWLRVGRGFTKHLVICVFTCVVLQTVCVSESIAQRQPLTESPCETGVVTEAGYPNIYCFELIPTPSSRGVTGQVGLIKKPSPFTVDVNREGIHTYQVQLTLNGLPAPDSYGPYTTYMAWITTPQLRPAESLGPVDNGTQMTGSVSLNKYIVMVSAEADSTVKERTGPLILRARSPSSLMEAHDLAILSPVAVLRAEEEGSHGHMHHDDSGWRMPPMHPGISMAPGMSSLKPDAAPYVPVNPDPSIPVALPQQVVNLEGGDRFELASGLVRKVIGDRELVMYGFNGQFPGPLLQVNRAAKVNITFTNNLEWPTAVHWHGLRLSNANDGVPGLTQDPIMPGETFEYEVVFPDAGIYWYHPHHREDVQQDLGLYGSIHVDPDTESYWNTVDVEENILLDDILLDDEGHIAFGRDHANFVFMGRFGNTFLTNGQTDYTLEVGQRETARLYLTNVSNTRVFNLSIPGVAFKLIASDISKYESESWVENIVIAPAERYVVEARFDDPGTYPMLNSVQAIDHLAGVFFPEIDTIGTVVVAPSAGIDRTDQFEHLRINDDVVTDIDRYREYFSRPVDRELLLTMEAQNLDPVVQQLMQLDPMFFNPVEWAGTMPMMNWQSTPSQVRWILRDVATGDENDDIDWSFSTSDVVKIRLHNDRDAFHAMQHPIHLHGQRFLVLEQDGVVNDNLVWKDTVLLPVGSTADILLDISNPGKWMLHCHIAEHLETGMSMVFSVDGQSTVE